MTTLTKPIMLDETGLKIVDAINSKGIMDIINNNTSKLDETISTKEKFANCFNEYYKNLDVNIEDMKEEDKSKFLNAFGSLLALDTKNKYAKCSDHQKKYIRSCNYHLYFYVCMVYYKSTYSIYKRYLLSLLVCNDCTIPDGYVYIIKVC